MKTVEFMVESNQEYLSDMPYRVVDGYNDGFNGYDIYQVETDDISKIRVLWESTGIEYVPDRVERCKDGVYVVTVWTPINAE